MKRRTLLSCGLLAATLALLPAWTTPPAQTVHVMRHLNTPPGERDPDLTEEGRRNAEALVNWFEGKPLAAIYVTDYKRTRQTAQPLAAKRGLTAKVYNPADTPALIAAIRAEAGPVLVVGHSNTVPDIVEQLGGERPAPLSHPDFGDVWSVTAGAAVKSRLTS